MATTKVLRLAKRPEGKAALSDFTVAVEELPPLLEGEVRVKNFLLGVDPTLRIWMSDQRQYMPPNAIGDVMRGFGLGVVEESRDPSAPVGTLVSGLVGWTERFNVTLATSAAVRPVTTIPGVPIETYLGQLSATGGLTAFFGFEVCQVKPGETLVVTGAAGNVGSLVGQLGKLAGARVIGIAGGPDKCRRCVEKFKYDECIDYKSANVAAELDRLCPNGIDALFENVGGDIMNEILYRMNNYGRVSICGLVGQYNQGAVWPAGPTNFPMILMRRLTVRGWIVSDFAARFGEAMEKLVPLVLSGALVYDFHELGGDLTGVVDALNFLLDGKNNGKMIYRLAPNPQ